MVLEDKGQFYMHLGYIQIENRESILFVYAQQNEFADKRRKQDIWLEEANLYAYIL